MTEPKNKEADPKRVGLFSWLLRIVAWLGVAGVVGIEGWSRLAPAASGPASALLLFASILGMSYIWPIGLAGAGVTLCCALRRLWWTTTGAGMASVFALAPFVVTPVRGELTYSAAYQGVAIYSANIKYGQANLSILVDDIRASHASVVLIQESTPNAEAELIRRLAESHPHVVRASRPDAFGQTTLSSHPFSRPPVVFPSTEARPPSGWVPQIGIWIEPTVVPEIGPSCTVEVEIWNVHTLPPVGIRPLLDHDAMSRGLAELLDRSTADVVVFSGDFNAPERSATLRRLTDRGAINSHSSTGEVFGWTWPVGGRRAAAIIPLRTRIDHLLAAGKNGLEVGWEYTKRGKPNGSDHLPITAEIDVLSVPSSRPSSNVPRSPTPPEAPPTPAGP